MSSLPDPTTTTAYTLATWIFLLHVDGQHTADQALHQACAAINDAEEEEAGNKAGEALVQRVKELLNSSEPKDVLAVVQGLYDRNTYTDLGEGSREERIQKIRQYQFSNSRPWMARIWERHEDGSVAPTWMVIERVTDQVTAMDPNPWNDIDETRHVPLADFQVLWELDGCTSIHIGPDAELHS